MSRILCHLMKQNAIRVRLASENDLPAWQAFVDCTLGAGGLHHAGWHGVLRDADWVTALFFMGLASDETIAGILPAYLSGSPLTGVHISSLECGIRARRHEAAASLLAEAVAARDHMKARYLQIRGGSIVEASRLTLPAVRTVIATDRPQEVLWWPMKQSCRRAVRKGAKEAVVIEHDPALHHLSDFYRVYAA